MKTNYKDQISERQSISETYYAHKTAIIKTKRKKSNQALQTREISRTKNFSKRQSNIILKNSNKYSIKNDQKLTTTKFL